ncbi:MAG TPA: GMC family oxidoreductase N-terminal domain-containing protein [Casimicrobiaceae bacterium]|nr:GMC family oxidoreductase N-terminal domain-containing protein [Casimicrobiaceae bacterium]
MTKTTPETETVDYCIVGAGPAGCVLASRLSENGRLSVTLLEAGQRDRHPFMHIPAAFIFVYNNARYNWQYKSEPEPNLCNRTLVIAQGKVLGGSSTINGMLHVRGQKEDFDQWSQAGCRGWSYEDLLPYFRKAETYRGNVRTDASLRGFHGPHVVSDATVVHPLTRAFVEGAQEIGMPYIDDMNGATREGASYFQHNRDGRFRSQPAQTYLRIARNRPNLQIKVETTATRVHFDGTRATGVSYVHAGQSRRVRVRKEVIVSAGVFKSPHLLQLSGIGDPDVLRDIGIPVVAANRSVGRNLRDHFLSLVVQRVRGIATLNEISRGPRLAKEVMRYAFLGKGLLTLGTGSAACFFRSRPGLRAPDAQLMFVHGSYGPVPGVLEREPGMSIGSWPSHPQSHGTVFSRSANPLDPPAIRVNFLSSEEDQRIVAECIRRSRAIFASRAMSRWSVKEVKPGSDVRTDDEVIAYARQNGRSGMHFAGTCRMGADEAAVVDPELRVRGVLGLRVVDASVMPNCTVGNINATIVAIAERAANLISSSP